VAALALALAGCGGGGDEQDAESLLDKAFATPIPSANVDISAELDLDGLAGLGEPLRVRASGPYVRARGRLPQLDIDVEIRTRDADGALETGFLSTGERVFLEFGGVYYEQDPEQVAATNRRLARDRERGGDGSLADLGLDARAWVVDAEVVGTEDVGGASTDHVSGTLDVAAVLEDLDGLVRESGGALGDGRGQLGEEQIERLASAVGDPSFDVYVGREDGVVRRLTVRLDVTVPEDDRQSLGGLERAAIRLTLELDDVGGDQAVTAPRNARPIAELTSLLGGLDALAADSLGAGGEGAPDAGAGEGGATADDFEAYGDCLEQAAPNDAEAIDRCSQLLP